LILWIGAELMDEIFSFKLEDFPRIARLQSAILKAEPQVSLPRSKLLVDYFEKNGFDLERPVFRQADSLRYILRNIEPRIFPEELIVASCTEHRLGCVMFPEFQAAVIWPELVSLPYRKRHPVKITDEAIEEFSFRIFPYFMEKNIHEWTKKRHGYPDSLKLMEKMVFYLIALPNGVSHLIPNYPVAIQQGFNRIKEMARQQRNQVSGNGKEAKDKHEFYEAIEIVSDGVIEFALNHSKKCLELAQAEHDPKRKEELEKLSRILQRVPAEPAESFWEALEGIWITHVAILQENSDLAMSFGRMDQFLLPYYLRDIETQSLDLKQALELILCFYIKTNDHTPLVPKAGESLFSGSATNQSITLSGLDPAGKDCTNVLSYLMLKALDLLRLREPNVDARFHSGSSKVWYQRVMEVVRSTGAAPALYNDEAIVKALTSKGASIPDARDYGVIGCVETTVQGKAYGMTGSILLNLAEVLELTLNNGIHPLSGLQIGPKTGWLRQFEEFSEFWNAFSSQLRFLVDMSVDAEIFYDKAHKELHPIPLLSALVEGPMEKGKDLTDGGALYNSSGVWVVGLADVVDSLASLKKLVFEEKRISPQDMEDALRKNFQGYEKIQAMCINRAPKYGNDEAEADEIAVRVVEEVDRAYSRHRNYRGGPYHIGYWTMTMHTGYGRLIGALPSGRKKGQALASGATPVSGVARKGPSASLISTSRLPPGSLANCMANNHKIPAYLLKGQEKMNILEQLVRGYFEKGGMQIQFVIADKSMLVSAMNNQDMARDLLVRVSGYTAYFGDLDRATQEEIINRTEDNI
jgi:pyruvate formate-lyase/glycerol dehydratase family glycyl radical enzyme